MHDTYDIIVAGSGAAGLTAAIVAQSNGLRVLVVEKTGYIGGTTAYSGGVAWVPGSRQNVESGIPDSIDRAEEYLDSVVPSVSGQDTRRYYLERGPEAFAYIEDQTGPLFFVRPSNSPDYYPDAKGASQEGRAITPLSFDGRELGDHFCDIRPPLPEFCLFGRQMLELNDIYHLLRVRKSVRSAWHAMRLMLRDLRDRTVYRRYGRGTWLTGGNALVGRLYRTILDRGIEIERDAPIIELTTDDTGVTGAVVQTSRGRKTIKARRGVVLATGGFPWGDKVRNQFLGQVPSGFSATSPDSTGDGIAIALANGAGMERNNIAGAFWAPVSIAKRKDGTEARFPHLMADRAKPGLIAVNRQGKRFFNEAENYHDFVRAMIGGANNEEQQPVHLVCDATFVSKYVFGMVPPIASERRRFVKSGYLITAETLDGLTDKIGVDRAKFHETIARHNSDAMAGIDTEFGKGSTAYNRYLGDASHKPNPCMAPMDQSPFYAIRVFPGDIGTVFGLSADKDGRVLNDNGAPIRGLYACGNDRSSIMGGFYPSGGITIGPALTFAYLAVIHAAGSQADLQSQESVGKPVAMAN